MRSADSLLDQYASDHQNASNQWIHLICVPAILWSVTALLWCIPVPTSYFNPGTWCGLAMFAAFSYYWQLSKNLAIGSLLCFVAIGFLNRWIMDHYGLRLLLQLGISVFIVAWIGQFIGHKIEGKRPSFFTDLVYLLIGPMWTLDKLYRRIGIGR
ncbi:DUF962 domain-containing protein [Arenimonas oryziterrae]|uniref:Membrane protein YGL010W n=1 Tax=Arenimonas oryziterrae DSM 21050 = YC6267 TaxID=1121015 RepID=A0A091AQR3_9GAMM|nr:Mpo1-like protein [Arenimonas oryziterrae]KFN42498.1 hypothetical protein N789_12730 [Arenimonas oryziterrae DSM 21050 = YC6267]